MIHAYENKPDIEEQVFPAFYLPHDKVYIEYWDDENIPKYSSNKKLKLEIYDKPNIEVIKLNAEDMKSLNDILPQKLREHRIETNLLG